MCSHWKYAVYGNWWWSISVTFGVPQGSWLAWTLFLIFNNYIAECDLTIPSAYWWQRHTVILKQTNRRSLLMYEFKVKQKLVQMFVIDNDHKRCTYSVPAGWSILMLSVSCAGAVDAGCCWLCIWDTSVSCPAWVGGWEEILLGTHGNGF